MERRSRACSTRRARRPKLAMQRRLALLAARRGEGGRRSDSVAAEFLANQVCEGIPSIRDDLHPAGTPVGETNRDLDDAEAGALHREDELHLKEGTGRVHPVEAGA